MSILDPLNQEQLEAVTKTINNDTLLLAGPGSGKTRVLQTRFAYIVEQGISPRKIMAITFTNKAANELKERIGKHIDDELINKIYVGTFHGISIKLLHISSKLLGINNNFTIADDKDALTIIHDYVNNMLIEGSKEEALRIQTVISDAKNNMIGPDQFQMEYLDKNAAMIYPRYQNYLERHNLYDFDDIILNMIKHLENNEQFRNAIHKQFKYIMVDEVQDTNTAQHTLVKLLAGQNNVFMVGDLDQSLYSWRGAKPEYFNNFLQHYPNGQVMELSQNYRSTKTIINIADAVISQNPNRFPKTMTTVNQQGSQGIIATFKNEYEEARNIAITMRKYKEQGYNYSDMAVLYRTNMQSRILEDAFIKNNIPYDIISGTSFYKRQEIKDMMAYLKLMVNLEDDISLRRVLLQQPGIGSVTISKLAETADENNTSIFHEVLNNNIYRSRRASVADFVDRVNTLNNYVNTNEIKASKALEIIFDKEYKYLINKKQEVYENKKENINELVNFAKEFEDKNPSSSVLDFIESFILKSDQDSIEDGNSCVKLMTGHASKGLEYKLVFIVNVEEGFLPHTNCLNDPYQVQEERRLFFVMITRAQEKVFITSSIERLTANPNEKYRKESRFIKDIPKHLIIRKSFT